MLLLTLTGPAKTAGTEEGMAWILDVRLGYV